MSSSRKKFSVKHPLVVDLGCGCRRGKLSSLFSSSLKTKPKAKPYSAPKQQPQHHHHYHHPLSSYYPFSPSTSATSPWETSQNPSSISTTTATSLYEDEASSFSSHANCGKKPTEKKTGGAAGKKRRGKGRVGESVAVVKESEDPYVDFRDSMLQMILEKEIFAWEDLQDLLNRFLSLNAPCHHDIIVKAFSEIWNGVFSYAVTAPPSDGGAAGYRKHGRTRRRGPYVSREP